MVEFLQSLVALVVTLSILVTFHEFGHYWVARYFNVHVLRFSVGFGKPFFIKRGRPPEHVDPPAGQEIQTRSNEPLEGTEFAIAAIPLGGYVKMLDEREGFVPDDMKHLAFNRKPVLQRIAIVAAGPIANFLLAIVAYWLLFSVGVTGTVPRIGPVQPDTPAYEAGFQAGEEIVSIDGEAVRTWSDVNMQLFGRMGETGTVLFGVKPGGDNQVVFERRVQVVDWLADVDAPYPTASLGLRPFYPPVPARIGGLVSGEPAELAGFEVGDEMVGFNGEDIRDWSHAVDLIQASPGEQVVITVRRVSQDVLLEVTPRSIERDGKRTGFLGASAQPVSLPPDMSRIVSYPVYIAWIPAVEKTWSITVFTLDSIGKLILGDISTSNLSGPITIAQVASATAQSGFESFIGFIALLSISLGVINLLPIPVLDGGHLLYYLFELVTRKPVPEKVQEWGMQLGIFLLAGIMLLAFYNDLARL